MESDHDEPTLFPVDPPAETYPQIPGDLAVRPRRLDYEVISTWYEKFAGEFRRAVVEAVEDWPTLAELDDDAVLGLASIAAHLVEDGLHVEPAPLQDRPVARNTDPDTSHAAALSVGDLRPRQMAVYEILADAGDRGMTDEELLDAYQRCSGAAYGQPRQSPSGIRTRRAELVAGRLAVRTGERRRMKTGRMAQVWRTVEAGQ